MAKEVTLFDRPAAKSRLSSNAIVSGQKTPNSSTNRISEKTLRYRRFDPLRVKDSEDSQSIQVPLQQITSIPDSGNHRDDHGDDHGDIRGDPRREAKRQQAFTVAHDFSADVDHSSQENHNSNHYLGSSEEVLYTKLVLRGRCFSTGKRLVGDGGNGDK